MIAWVDTETTGLDERKGELLEVALVVTDDELVERAATSMVVKPGCDVTKLDVPLVVREMHEKSGLLAAVAACQEDKLAVQAKLTAWLGDTFGRIEDLRQIPLAGSTVGFDRRWLRQHMPAVDALFHYRSIDVSALTELAQRWKPTAYASRPTLEKGVAHRALDDARASIDLLRHYRRCGFVGGIAVEAAFDFTDGGAP